jgi:hypothetical protein
LWLLSLLYHLPLSYFIDHSITYLLITSQTDEVRLAEYVCTHLFVVVFLAADPDYLSRVEGVRSQVDPVGVNYLSRVML